MYTSKREGELKSAFTRELKDQLPHFIVLLLMTNGAPDRAIVGNGVTTFWEYKHCTPGFESPGNQELMCMRLAVQSYCRYVLWFEVRGKTWTIIVHPDKVHDGSLIPESWTSGFDHKWLVNEIRKRHERQR